MDEKFLWGIIGAVTATVVSTAILGIWKYVAAKRDDVVRLTADLSQPGDLEVMQRIGCACMVVTVKSTAMAHHFRTAAGTG